MTSKAEAKAFEQKRHQEITDRVKHGKAPSITLSEAAMRYFETTLKPGGDRAKLKRDLGDINRIVIALAPTPGLPTSVSTTLPNGATDL
jgi:hypothetical protein